VGCPQIGNCKEVIYPGYVASSMCDESESSGCCLLSDLLDYGVTINELEALGDLNFNSEYAIMAIADRIK